jgi:hypothetical protein
MTEAEARTFATEWIAAWNSHDLERILSHYAEDIQVTSPLIPQVLGINQDTVSGRLALRAYWGPALVRFPDLNFKLFAALPGPKSVVLYYQSVKNLVGAEFMEFDDGGRVRRVVAHYAQGA